MLLARRRRRHHQQQQQSQQRPDSSALSLSPSSQSSSLVIKGNDGLPLHLNDLALAPPVSGDPCTDPVSNDVALASPEDVAAASPSLTTDTHHLPFSLEAGQHHHKTDPPLRGRRSSLTACFPRIIRALTPCIPHSHSHSDARHHAQQKQQSSPNGSASDSTEKTTGSSKDAPPLVLFPSPGNGRGSTPLQDLNPKPTSYMSRTIEPSFTTHDSSRFGPDESAYATTLSLTSTQQQQQQPRPVHRQGSRSSQMARLVPVPISAEGRDDNLKEAEDGKWVRRISTALPRPPVGSPPGSAAVAVNGATAGENNLAAPAQKLAIVPLLGTDSQSQQPNQPLARSRSHSSSSQSRPPTPTASPALTSDPSLESPSTPAPPLQRRASIHGSSTLSRSASVDVRRQREPRYERVWPDQANDITALADMMRSLWNGYTTTVLLRHPEVSRHALVVALYSTLVTQNTARGDSLQRSNSVAQLHAMLRHSQIPTELLVPPPKISVSSSTTSSEPSSALSSSAIPRSDSTSSLTAVLLSNQSTGGASAEDLHLLHSAQWLVTHHIASAIYALFAKLENMHCVPMLRSLLARQRDDIPLFLATCPKEVTAVYTHLSASAIPPPPVPSKHDPQGNGLDRSESSASMHSTGSMASTKRRPWDFMDDLPAAPTPSPPSSPSPSPSTSNPLPAWFANPSATALDRLGALLQREMTSTCTLLIRVLYSAGLSIPSAQHLYNMVIRSVRLFAYMMAAQPKLRWTWTPCDRPAKSDTMRVVNRAALSDAFDMTAASGIGSLTRGVRLSVLFSVSPGLVLDEPNCGKDAVPQLVVPELVFAVPASRLHLRVADPLRPLSAISPSTSTSPIGRRQTGSAGLESRGSWMSAPVLALSRRASTGDAFVPPARVHSAVGGLGRTASVTVSPHVHYRNQHKQAGAGRLLDAPLSWSPLTAASASPQSSMMHPIVSPLKEEYEPEEQVSNHVNGYYSHYPSATPARTTSSHRLPTPPPPHLQAPSRPPSTHTRTSGSTTTSGRPNSHHRAHHTPSPLSSSRRSSSAGNSRPSSMLLLEAVTQAADAALHHAPDAAGSSADLVHLWLSATEAALVHDDQHAAIQAQVPAESMVDSGLMIADQQVGGSRATFMLHDDEEDIPDGGRQPVAGGDRDSATTVSCSPPLPLSVNRPNVSESPALATPVLSPYALTPEVVATVVLHEGGPRASVLSTSSGSSSIGVFMPAAAAYEGPGGMSRIPALAAVRSGSTSPVVRF